MKTHLNIAAALLAGIWMSCSSPQKEENTGTDELRLWYTQPASIWEEALPIGNGRLGAMVFGGVETDRIQFNEETLWTGKPHDYSHPGAARYLEKIRELLWAGKQDEAEALAMEHFMSIPLRQLAYQPFGDVYLHFNHTAEVRNYERELSLNNAECKTHYSVGDTTFTREYLASSPDQAIAIHLGANQSHALNFGLSVAALHEGYSTSYKDDGTVQLHVQVKDGALHGTAELKVILDGGTLSVQDTMLTIKDADAATIYLVAATNFVNPTDVSGNPDELCARYLKKVENKTFEEVKDAHVADFQNYFNRFNIHLGPSIYPDLPTNERIVVSEDSMDNALVALYVQYGRYLLLSSSRAGTYPSNLQGIWNDKIKPSWDSKYTMNINAEMNYWPAEVLNLSECHDAFFNMVEETVESGTIVAQVHYNAPGWVLHHNTDLWRGAAPINNANHGIWVGGSGWAMHHFWEHFLYSRDTAFLRERAWPLMKGAAAFYKAFLVKDPKTGYLVSCPSNSPEHGGLVSGPTMDHQIIKSLFKICIQASEILGEDPELAASLQEILPQIAPYQIGQYGQLQEWMEDKDDTTNHHRHVSHLWGVHPGKEINWQDTPELIKAAEQSLVYRGDEGTGWSLAWKINFWARFRDGDHSWDLVKMLLRSAIRPDGSVTGGTYPNLFDAHAPFQIDGNFGGAAGVLEMLVQSHLDAIDILPALPSALANGRVSGVRLRGGFELAMAWNNGQLDHLEIESLAGLPLSIRYGDKTLKQSTRVGQKIILNGELNVEN